MTNIDWFKVEMASLLIDYEVEYKFFENGDYGSLNQIEFNKEEKGGGVDFWSSGWLAIHFVDYIKGEVLLNVFLEPHQKEEKVRAFKKLQEFLQ